MSEREYRIAYVCWQLLLAVLLVSAVIWSFVPSADASVSLDILSAETIEDVNALRVHYARDSVSEGIFEYGGVRYQIMDVGTADDFLEVFVRAWSGDVQYGFGNDGRVDIERFRFHRPPLKVPSGEMRVVESDDDYHLEPIYIYDPYLAMQKEITETISRVGLLGAEIESGKIGNTVTVQYPEADPASTAGDCQVYQDYPAGSGQSWATLESVSSCNTPLNNEQNGAFRFRAQTCPNWDQYRRNHISFPDPSIDDGDTVSSIVLTVTGYSKNDGCSIAPSLAVVESTVVDPSSCTYGDIDNFNTTQFSTSIGWSSLNASGDNDYTFNSSGLSAFNKSSVNPYMLLDSIYDLGASTPSCSNDCVTDFYWRSADYAGTTDDPTLTITHAVSDTGSMADVGTVSSYVGHWFTVLFAAFVLCCVYLSARMWL